jgi:hypothetical protein
MMSTSMQAHHEVAFPAGRLPKLRTRAIGRCMNAPPQHVDAGTSQALPMQHNSTVLQWLYAVSTALS